MHDGRINRNGTVYTQNWRCRAEIIIMYYSRSQQICHIPFATTILLPMIANNVNDSFCQFAVEHVRIGWKNRSLIEFTTCGYASYIQRRSADAARNHTPENI